MIRFVTGVGFIVGGVMVIPYLKQILDALIGVAETLFPTLNAAQSFFINSLPIFALVMIFIVGGFLIFSSLMRRGGGDV